MKDEKTINGNDNSITIKCDGLLQDEYTVEGNYEGFKFGPELEFFVVDKVTFKPKNCLDELAGLSDFGKLIKPELAAEQIEIIAPPSESIRDLEEALTYTAREVVNKLDEVNACLLPISLFDTAEFTITPEPRYQLLIDTLGPDFRKNAVLVASDQINIGASNELEAFNIFGDVRYLLPILMGLSASSPFKKGKENGTASNRMDVYDAAINEYPNLTGIPPRIGGLEDYAKHLENLPVFQHPNMFYKYARPMPHRGVAVEIRCIDKQPTIEDYLALVALSKAFIKGTKLYIELLQDTYFSPPTKEMDPLFRITRGEDNYIEGEFNRARIRGIADPEHYKNIIASSSLGPEEGKYLEPLYDRIENGSLADNMIKLKKEHGLEISYRIIAQNFVDSLK
ncbi:MAG: glutamate-cysteine ligase family protein [Candidatus Thorarchaeota archaeon]